MVVITMTILSKKCYRGGKEWRCKGNHFKNTIDSKYDCSEKLVHCICLDCWMRNPFNTDDISFLERCMKTCFFEENPTKLVAYLL